MAKRVPLTTKFPIPEDTHTVVVMVPHYWGKGTTKAAAMANLKKEGGRPGESGYIAYYFGPGIEFSHVDGMGGLHWDYKTDAAKEAQQRPVIEEMI